MMDNHGSASSVASSPPHPVNEPAAAEDEPLPVTSSLSPVAEERFSDADLSSGSIPGPTSDVQQNPVVSLASEGGTSSRSHLTVFTFHAAVREHRSVQQIESIRQRLTANPEIKYSLGDALKFAIMYGHTSYSGFLLANHLETALLPAVCCPLLLLSVRLDRPAITEQLCHYSRLSKACPNYINTRGCSAMEFQRTALHVAAEMSSVTVLQILLRYGADTDLRDEFNNTPLDRVLLRLPAAHLTFNSVRCAWELLKCQPVLNPKTYVVWRKLVARQPGWEARLDRECQSLQPGPFSLMQQCRCVIRRSLGNVGLPQHISKLGLPVTLQTFLSMEC